MGLSTNVCSIDLSRESQAMPLSQVINQLPCVQNASGATPSGILGIYAGSLPAGLVCGPSDADMLMQFLRRILMGATAASFLVVTGDEKVDARQHALAQWIPQQSGEYRSNADLRIERLVALKSASGASNSDLARMLRISRTQLYKWLSDDYGIRMEASNWKRLSDLAQIAREWNKLSARPMRVFLHEKVEGTRTMLELLSAAQLDFAKIRPVVAKYAKAQVSTRVTREDKLRLRGVRSRRPDGTLPWDE